MYERPVHAHSTPRTRQRLLALIAAFIAVVFACAFSRISALAEPSDLRADGAVALEKVIELHVTEPSMTQEELETFVKATIAQEAEKTATETESDEHKQYMAAGIKKIGLDLENGYLVIAGQSVKAPMTDIKVPVKKDLAFKAEADEGFVVESVAYQKAYTEITDQEIEASLKLNVYPGRVALESHDGVYTIPQEELENVDSIIVTAKEATGDLEEQASEEEDSDEEDEEGSDESFATESEDVQTDDTADDDQGDSQSDESEGGDSSTATEDELPAVAGTTSTDAVGDEATPDDGSDVSSADNEESAEDAADETASESDGENGPEVIQAATWNEAATLLAAGIPTVGPASEDEPDAESTDATYGVQALAAPIAFTKSSNIAAGIYAPAATTQTIATEAPIDPSQCNGTAKWNGNTYNNSDTTITNGTLTINGDWYGDVAIDGNVTINGNGRIICSGGAAVTIKGGNVVMEGNVTITNGNGWNITGKSGTAVVDQIKKLEPRDKFRVGGGVFVRAGTFTLKSGKISGNAAQRGGGIFVNKGATFIMEGGEVSNNKTVHKSDHSSTTKLLTCVNNATTAAEDLAGEGGGIFVWGTATIKGGTICNNTCYSKTDLGGGGIYINNGGMATLVNAKITQNDAAGFGGGIAGCCHGESSLVATDGVALYGNTAQGKSYTANKEGSSNANVIDEYNKAKSQGITGANSMDFYTAGSTLVSNYMAGGGSAQFTGRIGGKNVTIPDETVEKYENTNVALVAHPSAKSIELIPKGVTISGNKSMVHGGGIGCNGGLYFGANSKQNFVYDYLDLPITATKTLNGAGLKAGQFTFDLYYNLQDKEPVATATNDGTGTISFKFEEYQKISEHLSNNVITFYLKERAAAKPADGTFVCDQSVYKIEITLEKSTETKTETLSHTTGGNSFKNVTVTYEKNTYTPKATKTTRITSATGTSVNESVNGNPTFSNTYVRDRGSLTLTKALKGNYADVTSKTYTFDITGPDNYQNTVTITGAGSTTIGDLPTGVYTVTERDANLEGYSLVVEGSGQTATVNANSPTSVTITNTYTRTLGSLTLTKAVTGDYPDAESKSYEFTVTGPEGYNNTVTIVGTGSVTLPNLVPGDYVVKEQNTEVEGYKLTVEGEGTVHVAADQVATTTVTNHYVELIDKTVHKLWSDADNQDGLRPASVNVQLYADGVVTGAPVTLNADNGWSHTWTDLPKTANGAPIMYAVQEVGTVAGYTTAPSEDTFTITNTHEVNKVKDFTVTKTWNDDDNRDGIRPASVSVQLKQNGVNYGAAVELNEQNGWRHTWSGLPEHVAGQEGVDAVYTVAEPTVPNGYTASVTGDLNQGFTIANTHTPAVVEKSVAKVWADAENQDNLRPASVAVQLKANGEPYGQAITLNETNQWHYTWTGLPKNANGSPITYTVEEIDVPAGYTVTVAANEAQSVFTVTNTHTPNTLDQALRVTKVWADANNQDGKRPSGVTVQLQQNGEAYGDPVTLNEANGWAQSWEHLPEHVAGQVGVDAVYTVVETDTGTTYEPAITGSFAEGYTVTNSYTPGKVSKTVTKVWEDANNQDGIRPESVSVQLKQNGENYGEAVELNAANSWSYTWTELPEYVEGAVGQVATYTVAEIGEVAGYTTGHSDETFTITNSHTPDVVAKTVRKVWVDADNQDGLRPETLEAQLLKNGVPEGAPVVLNAANNWSYTWENLPKNAAGEAIVYSVAELAVSGDYTKAADESGLSFTNTHEPAVVSKTVKKVWEDANDQDGIRPKSVRVQLLANGVASGDMAELNAGNNWSHTWENLPKNAAGEAIAYTVEESTELGDAYETTYDQSTLTITNTHQPEEVEKTVTKVWEDADNQDGIRPDSVAVQLYADDLATGAPVTLNEANGWQYTWEHLPKNAAGNEIAYTVKETTELSGYTTDYDQSTLTITNTHEVNKVRDFSVTKVWEDADNQDGIRPESVSVQLQQNGTNYGEAVTLNAANHWTYTWKDLPEHVVGQVGEDAVYTVVEPTLPEGYTVNVKGSVATDFKITNTHEISTVKDFSVTKTWADANNQDGIRPGSVSVQLKQNGADYGEAVELNADNGWTHTWRNLPEYVAGQEGVRAEYTVAEPTLPEGYTAKVAGDIDQGFTIANTHEINKVKAFSVTKVWADADNQDGIRPESVSVQLRQNDTNYGEPVTLNEANKWTYTWEGLPEHVAGQVGVDAVYTVVEPTLPDTYSAEVNGDSEDGFTITNRHTPEETTRTVTKVWSDAGNQDDLRPDSVRVQLMANGKPRGDAVELNDENHWTYTWESLPVNENGTPIAYSVSETSVPDGYTAAVETSEDGVSYTLTNTHEPEVLATGVSVTKAWDDADNQDGVRAGQVVVQLTQNGFEYGDPVTLEGANDWTHTWDGLPKYVEGKVGVEAAYAVVEKTIPENYRPLISGNATEGYTITNSCTPGTVSKTVSKVWEDDDDQDGLRPDSITVELYQNENLYKTVTLPNDDGTWTYTWTDLPEYVEGAVGVEAEYAVREAKELSGYTTTYSDDTFTITNTHESAVTEKTVTKVWEDANDQDGIRPESVLVQLCADGEPTRYPVELTAENGWTATWTDLPVNRDHGTAIEYTVRELPSQTLKDYTTTVNADGNTFTITNTHKPAVTEQTVTKHWLDGDGEGRPSDVTVQLLQNDVAYRYPVTLAGDDWTYTWNDLPVYVEGGHGVLATYSVAETVPGGYAVAYGDDPFEITNTKLTAVTATKAWEQAEGAAPGEITLSLLRNGLPFSDTVTLTGAEEPVPWTYTWRDLPAYDGSNQAYRYTVEEMNTPEGYRTTYSDDTLTVTNTQLGSLTIGKVLVGGGSEAAQKTYHFTVTGPEGFNREVTITGATTTTLEGLVPGEYTITEADASIDGYELTVTGDKTATVEPGGAAQATVHNTYAGIGELKLTKVVKGGPVYAATDKPYKFYVTGPNGYTTDVTLTGEESTTLTGLDPGDYVVREGDAGIDGYRLTVTNSGTASLNAASDYKDEITVINEYLGGKLALTKEVTGDPDKTPESYTFLVTGPDDFRQDVAVKAGETVTLENLRAGTYEVTELGTAEDGAAQVEGYKLTVTGEGSVEVASGVTTEKTITNDYRLGTLTITKTVVGAPVGQKGPYTFTVAGPEGADPIPTRDVTLAAFEGDTASVTVDGLKLGTYTVTETGGGIEGYKLEVAVDHTAAIEAGGADEVAVTNTYKLGSLTIHKEVEGAPESDVNKPYTFTVTGPDGYSETVTVNGEGTATLTELLPGTYTVTEDRESATIEGYNLEVSGEEAVVLEAGDDKDTTVRNSYTEAGKLTVTKTVAGGGDEAADKAFTFTVTGPNGRDGVTPLTYISRAIMGGEQYTFEDLPFGDYTVQEMRDGVAIDGYTLTVTGVSSVTVGASASAIEVTNTYNENAVFAPTVAKTVNVIGGEGPAPDETFTFTLASANGEGMDGWTLPENVTTTVTGEGAASFGAIAFTKPGTYTFTVAESAGDALGWAYDTTPWTLTVVVGLDENAHKLVVERAAYTRGDESVEGDGAHATFTNTYQMGTLAVAKAVDGVWPETEREFPFTITLEPALRGTYGGVEFTDGVATFTLKGGEKQEITGLPAGVTYRVNEAADDYYTVAYDGQTGEIPVDATVQARVTNTRQAGDLELAKTVAGRNPDTAKEFTFRVVLTNNPAVTGDFSGMHFENNIAYVTLKHGEKATAIGLPAGAAYAITELFPDNEDLYSVTSTGATGVIPVGAAAEASFINTSSAGLTVVKSVVDDLDEEGLAFHFTVTLDADPAITGRYGAMEFVDNVAQVTLHDGELVTATDLPQGVGYSVVEQEADADGFETTAVGERGTVGEKGAVAAFKNERRFASLLVSKTVTSDDDEDLGRDYHFAVELDQPLTGEYGDLTFENGHADVTLRHGERRQATQLPPGISYTVTEAEADAEGFKTFATGDAGALGSGVTGSAVFNNVKAEEDEALGALAIDKLVSGGPAAAATTRAYTFRVTGPDGYAQTVTVQGGGTAVLDGLEPGDYQVRELDASIEGYSWTVEVLGSTTVEAGAESTTYVLNVYEPDIPDNPNPLTPSNGAPSTPNNPNGPSIPGQSAVSEQVDDTYTPLTTRRASTATQTLPTSPQAAETIEDLGVPLASTPKTGDDRNLGLWVGLGAVALAGLGACGVGVYRSRRRKKDDA